LWRDGRLKANLAQHITKNGKVLDVGGGTGVMAHFLPDFVDRRGYYNLDVSIVMLKYSSYNNILATAEQIPCSNNSFDYVISSESLEHVNDKMMTLRECYRVLKPGSYFLLSTPRTKWWGDFRKSPFLPFLIIRMVIDKLAPLKPRFRVPEGVKDEPSDEKWLKDTLANIGFVVLEQYRADNNVPWDRTGESKFWRWFADRFVDPKKYGQSVVTICIK
jgi:ubiquinone/menaquinone biosynthesis C-methylase UbiE